MSNKSVAYQCEGINMIYRLENEQKLFERTLMQLCSGLKMMTCQSTYGEDSGLWMVSLSIKFNFSR